MHTVNPTPSHSSNLSSVSSLPISDKNEQSNTCHIIAEECLEHLKTGRSHAAQSQLRSEMALYKTTDRLDKLKIKQHIIHDKHAVDFADILMRRIERKPDYCHKVYNKYQTFLDSHTRLQCISFYTFLEQPRLVNEFALSFIPRPKKWARDMHAEGLNLLSLGNNRKTTPKIE